MVAYGFGFKDESGEAILLDQNRIVFRLAKPDEEKVVKTWLANDGDSDVSDIVITGVPHPFSQVGQPQIGVAQSRLVQVGTMQVGESELGSLGLDLSQLGLS